MKPIDRFYLGTFREHVAAALASLPPASRLLDLGCGEGDNTNFFHSLGFDAIGIDLNPDRVASARARYPTIQFICADACSLPFAAASFDVVFSCSVLQYVDRPRFLRDCRRVLRSHGQGIFIENLSRHPLALLYRRIGACAAQQLPRYRRPQQHLDLNAVVAAFEPCFVPRRIFSRHLLSPLGLLAAKKGSRVPPRVAHGLISGLARVDQVLQAALPGLGRFSWIVLILADPLGSHEAAGDMEEFTTKHLEGHDACRR